MSGASRFHEDGVDAVNSVSPTAPDTVPEYRFAHPSPENDRLARAIVRINQVVMGLLDAEGEAERRELVRAGRSVVDAAFTEAAAALKGGAHPHLKAWGSQFKYQTIIECSAALCRVKLLREALAATGKPDWARVLTAIFLRIKGQDDLVDSDEVRGSRPEILAMKAALEYGLDPNDITQGGYRTMSGYCFGDEHVDFDMIHLLLDYGLRPEARAFVSDRNGDDQRESLDFLQELLSTDPEFFCENHELDRAIHPSLNEPDGLPRFNPELTREFLRLIDRTLALMPPAQRRRAGQAALDKAVQQSNWPAIEHLVKNHGVDVNGVDESNFTPLTTALAGRRLTIARRLIDDLGATPNPPADLGQSPMLTAMLFGGIDGVRLLVERGAQFEPAYLLASTGESVSPDAIGRQLVSDPEVESFVMAAMARARLKNGAKP